METKTASVPHGRPAGAEPVGTDVVWNGRTWRGERTRLRLGEALASLLAEGVVRPTPDAVAERAGVSVRTIFHHFRTVPALYTRALTDQWERHFCAVREVPADLPLDLRVEETVTQRAKFFERLAPLRRAVLAPGIFNDELAELVAAQNRLLRARLQATFAPELDAASAGDRLIEALDAATSCEVWDRLRRTERLSVPAARRAVERTLSGLLRATP
jgi:AcrR family transcriptional regulator